MFAFEISEKIRFFAFFLAILGVLADFQQISCHRFSCFARTILGLVLSRTIASHHCFRVGEKQSCGKKSKLGKRQFEKSNFLVLHQNHCRYWILECSIGTTQKYNQ